MRNNMQTLLRHRRTRILSLTRLSPLSNQLRANLHCNTSLSTIHTSLNPWPHRFSNSPLHRRFRYLKQRPSTQRRRLRHNIASDRFIRKRLDP